jgi:hypothetical protein
MAGILLEYRRGAWCSLILVTASCFASPEDPLCIVQAIAAQRTHLANRISCGARYISGTGLPERPCVELFP